MAAVRWAIVALMILAAAGAWMHWSGALGALSRGRNPLAAATFHCPMHPAVVQDRSGECPICGMDLVPVASAPAQAAPRAAGAAGRPDGRYWCPMHPEVTSDDPDARCEQCGGMRLLPRDPEAGTVKRGVPGLEAVEIPPDRTQLMGIRTARVERRRLAPTLRTVGFVNADEARVALVASRVTGWVEELRVAQTGQRVERGQVLATLHGPELVAAQQSFVNAVRWSGGAAPPPGGGKVPTVEGEARKRLELIGIADRDIDAIAARARPLDAVPVRAPIAGYVARRSALAGQYVQPGTELFQIADLSRVAVVADVYERDAGRIAVGQRARLSLATRPGEPLAGRVEFLYPAIDPGSRTVQARIRIEDAQGLRPGAYGDVEIDLAPIDGLAIPGDALVDTGEQQYVFVARGAGRFEPRLVRVGARAGDEVHVLEGLAEGEAVVTTANFLVDSESRMRAAVSALGTPRAPPSEPDEPEERHPRPRASR
jgi:multidrug efflux pump subunit AcrA (membrane-fusion protein)